MDEDNNWALDIAELQRAYDEGKQFSHPRVLCVINPGNPTGQVLSRENVEEIIKFAKRNNLFLMADEVTLPSKLNQLLKVNTSENSDDDLVIF